MSASQGSQFSSHLYLQILHSLLSMMLRSYNINGFCIPPGVDATNLLEGKLKFPGDGAKAKIAGMGAGASMFVPMTSIFIGLPSRCTLLYFLRAATADDLAENTTSAVPWKNGDPVMEMNHEFMTIQTKYKVKKVHVQTFDLPLLS